ERQNCGLSPRKCLCGARGSRSRFVKLQRPPPEMRIFSAIFSLWSTSSTFRPRWPAMPAQKRPAAPAPMTTASNAASAFPDEGELELPEESIGNIVAQHTVVPRPRLVALDGRAEQVIEEREVRGVVAVQRF